MESLSLEHMTELCIGNLLFCDERRQRVNLNGRQNVCYLCFIKWSQICARQRERERVAPVRGEQKLKRVRERERDSRRSVGRPENREPRTENREHMELWEQQQIRSVCHGFAQYVCLSYTIYVQTRPIAHIYNLPMCLQVPAFLHMCNKLLTSYFKSAVCVTWPRRGERKKTHTHTPKRITCRTKVKTSMLNAFISHSDRNFFFTFSNCIRSQGGFWFSYQLNCIWQKEKETFPLFTSSKIMSLLFFGGVGDGGGGGGGGAVAIDSKSYFFDLIFCRNRKSLTKREKKFKFSSDILHREHCVGTVTHRRPVDIGVYPFCMHTQIKCKYMCSRLWIHEITHVFYSRALRRNKSLSLVNFSPCAEKRLQITVWRAWIEMENKNEMFVKWVALLYGRVAG